MSFFEWSNDLDVGVSEMNDEHKVLIELMNKLYELNEAKASSDELMQAMQKLGDYTVEHFDEEEKYMAEIGFPGLQNHKGIHKQLLQKLGTHVNKFKEDPSRVPDDFFSFLKFWLAAHIKGIDAKYGAHQKKGAA